MRLEYKIDKDSIVRDFFEENTSRKFKRFLKRVGAAYFINSSPANNYDVLKSGDILVVEYDDIATSDEHFNDIELDIVYEDSHYMVINKPRGLKTIPTGYNDFNSLYNGILNYYKKNNINKTVHIINRLDKDTEGLLLVCKDKFTALEASRDIKAIKRWYLEYVSGELNGSGDIDSKIKRIDGIKRACGDDGKESLTHYRALKYDGEKTLVELSLETGRTHQIRVHMQSIGHPIIGDPLYGDGDNLRLCSYRIEFINYYDGSLIRKEIRPTFLED